MFLDVYKNKPWNYTWLIFENTLRYFTDLFNTPCFIGFKFIEDNITVGYCVGISSDYFVGNSFEIKEIFISRQLQNKGLGSNFLGMVEKSLKDFEVDRITLATQREIPAFDFYLKNGYEVSEGAVFLSKCL